MLLGDLLAHNARVHPARTALSTEHGEISHGGLDPLVRRTAAALHGLGVRKGDRVAVLSESSLRYVELLFAVPAAGGVFVPLNPLFVARELRKLLLHSRARLLLFASEFEERVNELRPDLAGRTEVYCIDSPRTGYPLLPQAGAPPAADIPLSDRDIALQVYTGERSGRPTGAMLSHRNLLAASASAAVELALSRKDVFLSCTPLPFIAGTGRLLRYLYVGGTIHLQDEFDPGGVLGTIERRKVTHVLLTPSMMARILSLPAAERYNLATLRMVLYGGSSIPLDLLRRAIRFFRCDMVQSYGQVESAGVLSFLHPEDHSLDESIPYMRKLTSVGKEAVGVEIRVVDRDGRQVAPDQVGEIVARGENIFEGYFQDPESTAEVLREGWLHTGDVASVDGEGYLYIVDRLRDALMVGGIPVTPREIESVLAEHPGVEEAAVVGRPDYALGEIPVAFLTLREGARADAEEILAHCRSNMAPFKVPRAVSILPRLPKNSAGKVLKARLREGILAQRG